MNEENENIFEEEDVILPDDFEDTPTEETEGDAENSTEQTSNAEETAEQQGQTEEQKLLNYLNSKGIKYNGENVKIEKLDDLIATYQKGLNYDKIKSKTEETENEVVSFIGERAQKAGLSVKDYIKQVQKFEEEQKKAIEEQSVQAMMEHGVDEETARRVARTEAYMETLRVKEEELNKQVEARKAEEKQNKEYEEFLKAYPEIEAEKIPVEVFENARNSNLKTAYAEYENKLLKEKIKQLEQNQKNASSSIVTTVSDKGAVEQEGKDAFLIGFDSVE